MAGKGGIYGRFDIIMVHYCADSSRCAAASYTPGQAECNSAAVEASAERISI